MLNADALLPQEASIQKGKPLPDRGSCKHYKRSFRHVPARWPQAFPPASHWCARSWLRFPCCGKAYPCDVCHEDKSDPPHEMKVRVSATLLCVARLTRRVHGSWRIA